MGEACKVTIIDFNQRAISGVGNVNRPYQGAQNTV